MRKKGSKPTAPAEEQFTLYFRENLPYFLDENGIERTLTMFEKTPASATAPGIKGTVCWNASYIYVCISDSVWKRVAISTWT